MKLEDDKVLQTKLEDELAMLRGEMASLLRERNAAQHQQQGDISLLSARQEELQAGIASLREELFFLDATDPKQQQTREFLNESLDRMLEEQEEVTGAIAAVVAKGMVVAVDRSDGSAPPQGQTGMVAKRVGELEAALKLSKQGAAEQQRKALDKAVELQAQVSEFQRSARVQQADFQQRIAEMEARLAFNKQAAATAAAERSEELSMDLLAAQAALRKAEAEVALQAMAAAKVQDGLKMQLAKVRKEVLLQMTTLRLFIHSPRPVHSLDIQY